MRVTLFVAALILAYGGFLVWRLGIHQRLPLAFGPISLESIPDRAARRHGERLLYTCDCPVGWRVPALSERYSDDVSWSAARIKSTAGYLATMLRECFDVQRGERVAILKQNHFDIHLLIAGIVRAGAIAVPLNGAFDAGGVSQYLDQVGATILFTDTATLRRLIAEGAGWGVVRTVVIADRTQPAPTLPPTLRVVWIEDALSVVTHESAAIRRGADDPVYLVHSSGTTGFPKAVILRNDAQSHAVRGWLCYVHLSRTRDRGYVAVPNNHQAVILTFNSSLLLGLRVHWDSSYGLSGFDPAHVISALARGRFTAYFGFPITYTQLKEVDLSRYDLSRMRIWASTADASHAAIQRAFVALGGAFRSVGLPVSGSVYLDAQGSSEVGTPSVLRYVTRFSRHFDRRVGRPGSTPFGPRVRIARDGVVVRRGEVGRLEVKGRTVFKAYWNDPGNDLRGHSGRVVLHRRCRSTRSRRAPDSARSRGGRDSHSARSSLFVADRRKDPPASGRLRRVCLRRASCRWHAGSRSRRCASGREHPLCAGTSVRTERMSRRPTAAVHGRRDRLDRVPDRSDREDLEAGLS